MFKSVSFFKLAFFIGRAFRLLYFPNGRIIRKIDESFKIALKRFNFIKVIVKFDW